MEFGEGVKMKKTTRKFKFVLRRRGDDRIIASGGRQDELDELTEASHKTSHGGSLRQQVKKTAEGDEDDQRTRLIKR